MDSSESEEETMTMVQRRRPPYSTLDEDDHEQFTRFIEEAVPVVNDEDAKMKEEDTELQPLVKPTSFMSDSEEEAMNEQSIRLLLECQARHSELWPRIMWSKTLPQPDLDQEEMLTGVEDFRRLMHDTKVEEERLSKLQDSATNLDSFPGVGTSMT